MFPRLPVKLLSSRREYSFPGCRQSQRRHSNNSMQPERRMIANEPRKVADRERLGAIPRNRPRRRRACRSDGAASRSWGRGVASCALGLCRRRSQQAWLDCCATLSSSAGAGPGDRGELNYTGKDDCAKKAGAERKSPGAEAAGASRGEVSPGLTITTIMKPSVARLLFNDGRPRISRLPSGSSIVPSHRSPNDTSACP